MDVLTHFNQSITAEEAMSKLQVKEQEMNRIFIDNTYKDAKCKT